MPKPTVVAHRGLHTLAPENSREAFRDLVAVNAAGFPMGIEFDIRTTRDGVPLINHDLSAYRLALAEYDYTDLVDRLGARTPMRLEEGLEILATGDIPLINPELKEHRNAEAVLRLIDHYLSGHTVVISSFLTSVVNEAQTHAPEHRTALLTGWARLHDKGCLSALEQSRADAVIVHTRRLDPELANRVRDLGKAIGVYTVNGSYELRRLRDHETVDYLITDRPDRLEPGINQVLDQQRNAVSTRRSSSMRL